MRFIYLVPCDDDLRPNPVSIADQKYIHTAMKIVHNVNTGSAIQAEADRLADFVLFTQRSCILNLSGELSKGNISYPQFFLLAYLSSEEYLTMTDIAKKMGHSTAAATGLVDRMEKLSYVERIHAAEDRRKIMVRITQKGVELVSRMRREIASDLALMLTNMDQEEADTVDATRRAMANIHQ